MLRIHRSIDRRVGKVDCAQVANSAEDYLEVFSSYRSYLRGVRGLVSSERLRKLIRKIDKLEGEMLRLENKIETVAIRRGKIACQLEDYLNENLDVLRECLEPGEFKEFVG